MTETTIWLIIVVALGVPGAVTGFLFRRLEKKLDQAEEKRAEKENTRQEYEKLLLELTLAGLSLSEATAAAVGRIPDAKCNGDMSSALEWSREIKNKYHQFAREQTAKAVNA